MKTFKVEIPEGFEIDKKKSTFEEIVFKEIKKELPKSWKELEVISGYYVDENSKISSANVYLPSTNIYVLDSHRNIFATEEQAEAAIAIAQLSQLKKVYNGDWEADFTENEPKYVIDFYEGEIRKNCYSNVNRFLSFKDEETRDLFLDNFKDLIEKAKPLMS